MKLRSRNVYANEAEDIITKNDVKLNSKWRRNGIYYGYPSCCITFFINECPGHLNEILSARPYSKILVQQGYIPCNNCHRKIIAGDNIHKLLVNRIHHMAFPNDNY